MFRILRGIDLWGPQNAIKCALYPYGRFKIMIQDFQTKCKKIGEKNTHYIHMDDSKLLYKISKQNVNKSGKKNSGDFFTFPDLF